jgi:hypothetical protein
MSKDRTIIRPQTPRFAIGEVAYLKASAAKGFVEPLGVADVRFDPRGFYVYDMYREFSRNFNGTVKPVRKRLMPASVMESSLVTLCEALESQAVILAKELDDIRSKIDMLCNEVEDDPGAQPVSTDRGLVYPPRPRYGVNSVVYLRESAESLGRLEAYRVSNFKWSKDANEWFYNFDIHTRPEKNMVVGDRNEILRGHTFGKVESSLLTLCEVLPLCESFLSTALQNNTRRRTTFCGGTEGD